MSSVNFNYKSKLINRINSIDDRNVLDEVNRLLEVDIDETIYQTTTKQKQEIEKSRLELSQNKGISAEKADKEIEKWLSR